MPRAKNTSQLKTSAETFARQFYVDLRDDYRAKAERDRKGSVLLMLPRVTPYGLEATVLPGNDDLTRQATTETTTTVDDDPWNGSPPREYAEGGVFAPGVPTLGWAEQPVEMYADPLLYDPPGVPNLSTTTTDDDPSWQKVLEKISTTQVWWQWRGFPDPPGDGQVGWSTWVDTSRGRNDAGMRWLRWRVTTRIRYRTSGDAANPGTERWEEIWVEEYFEEGKPEGQEWEVYDSKTDPASDADGWVVTYDGPTEAPAA